MAGDVSFAAAGSDGLAGDRLSRGSLIRRRFMRNKLAVFGLSVIVFMFFMAFVGPYLTKWSYFENDFDNLLTAPSREHWFGTTQVGVDVFAQTMRGLQKSLLIGILVAIFSTS
ncbi:MAG: peptide ABC transporter permease, partial [Actinobacteria bacterium]|nr:peptide ABC transporter permease [Actinomycetota bacterium]